MPAAIVGAGVLGLPYAMSFLGWPGGTVTLALSWVGLGFREPLHLWVVPLPGHHCLACTASFLGDISSVLGEALRCLWPGLCCPTIPFLGSASAAWLALFASCVLMAGAPALWPCPG